MKGRPGLVDSIMYLQNKMLTLTSRIQSLVFPQYFSLDTPSPPNALEGQSSMVDALIVQPNFAQPLNLGPNVVRTIYYLPAI